MKYFKTILIFLFIVSSKIDSNAQGVIMSNDGTWIEISCVIGNNQYSLVKAFGMPQTVSCGVHISTDAGTPYLLNVKQNGIIIMSYSFVTPNPAAANTPPTTYSVGDLSFDQEHPDGSPMEDGELLIRWESPTPVQQNICFRYRLSGSTTWSYSSLVNAQGFVYNGVLYPYFALTGLDFNGAVYEIQVVYNYQTQNTTYSTSFYGATLVD